MVFFPAVFSECLSGADQCIDDSKPIGQYPHCSDCAKFLKCAAAASAVIDCPSGLNYDVNLGVCGHIGLVTCG